MSQTIVTEFGKIIITEEAVSTVAGVAALECYGLVGMCSRSRIRDGFIELLGKENLSRGVEVQIKDGNVIIDLFVIVGYGTKISEVAQNIMEKVKYVVETFVGMPVEHVNVNVQGVRVNSGK
ncbi:MAG: Asp23/Gls24 family envelope stress response protein [Firmicutes bacterium]|nr:Asp23/Gls24 family envelope stress response protein [Dethiobacter sp.]MBS3888585.1 Asp23/Gls24 family envelope stress response protein [Bacillota bacterium]MBS4054149.1 Asp23/Gls24 family envelope stress response protein [Thermaerobacter sp.]